MKKVKLFIALTITLGLITKNLNAADTFKADVSKSKLEWVGEKVAGQHNGTINLAGGTLVIDGTKIMSGSFEIDMNSITNVDLTDAEWNQKLVGHLKSDDFFGVAKFPKATFTITGPVAFVKGSANVKGNLSIKGITQPITFKAAMQNTAEGIRFYAHIIVDRTKFDVRYGSGSFFDDLGDKTIYDEFKLKLNLLVTK